MPRKLQFSALECVLDGDLPNLLRHEWSMGNGQCPECNGVPQSWLGHPCHPTQATIGHKANCPMARAIKQLGAEPLMLQLEFIAIPPHESQEMST